MTISIRIAIKSDIPQILELYKELQPTESPMDIDSAVVAFDRAIGSGVTYFVAEDSNNGRIVATCFIAIIPNITRQCASIGFIENVVTASDYRRKGIGQQLLETTIAFAKSQGCYKVTLQSGNKRNEAHKFYESIGFDGNSKKAFEIRL